MADSESVVNSEEREAITARVDSYCDSFNGAVTKLVAVSGYSRETIRRVRDSGEDITAGTLLVCDRALDILRDEPPARVSERPSTYGEGKHQAALLVKELYLLIEHLESTELSHEQKKRKFRSFLDGYIDGWDEFIAAIDKKEVANNSR